MTLRSFLKIFCLLATTANITPLNAYSQMVDRLLVEVNFTAYTQRQFELYISCKQAISHQQPPFVTNIDPTNWESSIEQFIGDMIVDQEALRIGGFEPSRKMLDTSAELLEQKKKADGQLKAALDKLSLDHTAIVRSLAQVLRVEGYKRSKQRQATVADESKTSSVSLTTRLGNWHRELIERAIVRRFADAQTYIQLRHAASK